MTWKNLKKNESWFGTFGLNGGTLACIFLNYNFFERFFHAIISPFVGHAFLKVFQLMQLEKLEQAIFFNEFYSFVT